MKTIITIGSIITDLVVITDRFPAYGENILAKSFKICPGGKGANTAAAVAKLNARSILVGCIGNDEFGKQEIEALKKVGVMTDNVKININTSTGVAFIIVDSKGENTILVVNGANDKLKANDVEEVLLKYKDKIDGIIVNFEVPEEVVAVSVNKAHEYGILVVVDAGPPRTYSKTTWGKATIISPNTLEASTLVGYPINNDNDAIRASYDLLKAGPRAVVMKRGKLGALIVTNKEVIQVPTFPVKVVDTTGAGDAFTAGLTVALAEGKSLYDSVRFANAAGAIAVTRLGTLPVMPDRNEVEYLLNSS